MFCRKCGKQIDDDSEFCRFCGASNTESNNNIVPKYSCHSRGCGKPLKPEWERCPSCGAANPYYDGPVISGAEDKSAGDILKQVAKNTARDFTDNVFRAVKIMAVLIIICVIVLFFKGEL